MSDLAIVKGSNGRWGTYSFATGFKASPSDDDLMTQIRRHGMEGTFDYLVRRAAFLLQAGRPEEAKEMERQAEKVLSLV